MTPQERKVMELALEALENLINYDYNGNPDNEIDVAGVEAITAIKETLAVDKESLTTEARHMPSNDALYKAWNLIGADLAGLKFEDFVRHLSAQQNAERVSNEQVEPVAFDSEMKAQAKRAYPHDAKRELAFIDGWLSREATQQQNSAATDWAAVHDKLMDVWHRELSADEGLDEIQGLINTTPYVAIPRPQRTWVGMMRGIRVDGDTVVISVKGGNDAARELCAYLIDEMN